MVDLVSLFTNDFFHCTDIQISNIISRNVYLSHFQAFFFGDKFQGTLLLHISAVQRHHILKSSCCLRSKPHTPYEREHTEQLAAFVVEFLFQQFHEKEKYFVFLLCFIHRRTLSIRIKILHAINKILFPSIYTPSGLHVSLRPSQFSLPACTDI